MRENKTPTAKRIAREILNILERIEVGIEFEALPKPVVRLYARIRALRQLIEESKNEN